MNIFTWMNSLQMDLYNCLFMSFCTQHHNNKLAFVKSSECFVFGSNVYYMFTKAALEGAE